MLRDYPRGVFLVALVEFWERFSYWGLLALLTLYLSSPLAAGGFGWEVGAAIKLYGLYGGLAFAGPVLGGWIAASFWGERRCISVGGALIVAGHACLAGTGCIPWLGQHFTGVDYQSLWVSAGVPLGSLLPSADELRALRGAAESMHASASTVNWVYLGIAWSFAVGLLLIIAGTALLKPTISSIVGRFYSPGDRRRDDAFAMFFVAIYLGCTAGVLIAGFLGERVSWHWGFGSAGIGMAGGLAIYRCKQHELLGTLGLQPERTAVWQALRGLNRCERDRMKVLLCQGAFTVMYAATFYQVGGSLLLFSQQSVDRGIGAWQIPVSWMSVLPTVAFIAITPLGVRLWGALARRGRDPDATVKLAWGLLVIGAAYLLMGLVAPAADDTARISWWWMLAAFVLFGAADMLVWPNQISLASKLAPASLSALLVGGWYITIGIGTSLTGYIGAWAQVCGFRRFLLTLGVCVSILGCVAWLVTPRLRRLMHATPEQDLPSSALIERAA
ncbi:peptide MFS transporter [Steroidobacter sp.]|uniref:peptide MFS transporter n=1 Tax=Steroidobacter sp. TaxID=1978227 RepID=UPI001A5F46C4|nr:peptide MFS transporter [Steroidobacter sp.]MBL8267897.1 peptide MFS transporter [Steroidobacter sp.]